MKTPNWITTTCSIYWLFLRVYSSQIISQWKPTTL